MDKEELIKRLDLLPLEIKQQQEVIIGTDDEAAELDFRKKLIQNSIFNEVSNELEEDKPKYKNAQQREFETDKRLSLMPEYNEIIDKEKKVRKSLAQQKIYLQFLENKLSAAKSIARLFSNENQ